MFFIERFVELYLIIGIANWAAHQLTCPNCSQNFVDTSKYMLENIWRLGMWPLHAWVEFRPKGGEDIEKKGGSLKAEILQKDGTPFIEVEKRAGESVRDFMIRVNGLVKEQMKQKMDEDRK